jgi:hypothetical protein
MLVCSILRASGHTLRGCPAYGALLQRLLHSVAGAQPNGGGWALKALLALSEADSEFRHGQRPSSKILETIVISD